ncbi:sensor histidine kinase [Cohnella fermenti]|nr:ATP-binding protein [Cohnella fermenti]
MIPWHRSIAFRLFAVTFLVFLLFVGLLLVVLGGTFSSFYEQRQKTDIVDRLKQIAKTYGSVDEGNVDSDRQFSRFVPLFENDYFAKIAQITIEDGQITRVLMSGSGGGQQRDELSLHADVSNNPEMIVVPDLGIASEMNSMLQSVQEWMRNGKTFQDVMALRTTISYMEPTALGSASASSKQLIAISPLSTDGKRSGVVIFAVSSLQPVTHAARVFKDLSLYVFGAALVFVLLLAVGYARIVTKPLIRLNTLAGRLADLDFSARARWKRKDEIGALAGNLDFLADNLQSTLAELRTANEKLREDIEREKRLERMRRQFIAGVSHELKTPLSLIGGYAEGLKDNIGSGVKREKYAEVILDETRRMSAIVSDMLDLSHLESGQYSLKLEKVGLAELLGEAAGLAEALGEEKSLVVAADVPAGRSGEERSGGEAAAIGDRLRIGQVLTNLVTNAVRHAPEGGSIRLTVTADGDQWLVEVYNDGEPIPPDELPRIWGHFYRIDKARSRESGGTGIGLAIARQILTLHGSRFGVRNESGGVTFGFTLRSAARASGK